MKSDEIIRKKSEIQCFTNGIHVYVDGGGGFFSRCLIVLPVITLVIIRGGCREVVVIVMKYLRVVNIHLASAAARRWDSFSSSVSVCFVISRGSWVKHYGWKLYFQLRNNLTLGNFSEHSLGSQNLIPVERKPRILIKSLNFKEVQVYVEYPLKKTSLLFSRSLKTQRWNMICDFIYNILLSEIWFLMSKPL